jgi:hypothetical protein
MASQFHNLAIKLTNLLLDGIARFQQRSDGSHQLRTALDQLLGSYGKDIELGTANSDASIADEQLLGRQRQRREPGKRTWRCLNRLS